MTASARKKLFLSAVSSEFESYRQLLASDLKRPNLDVGVQEDFTISGGLTLRKLDNYIKACGGRNARPRRRPLQTLIHADLWRPPSRSQIHDPAVPRAERGVRLQRAPSRVTRTKAP